jgi:hypothetical protein
VRRALKVFGNGGQIFGAVQLEAAPLPAYHGCGAFQMAVRTAPGSALKRLRTELQEARRHRRQHRLKRDAVQQPP